MSRQDETGLEAAESVGATPVRNAHPVEAVDPPRDSPHRAIDLALLREADLGDRAGNAEAGLAAGRRDGASGLDAVHTALASLVLPDACACCGAPASASRRLDLGARAGVLIVPLCDRCLTHDAVSRTRSLSVVLAALLIGVAGALGLPLALERASESGAWQLSLNSWFSRWGLFLLPCGIVFGLLGVRVFGWYARQRLGRSEACAPAPSLALRETSAADDRLAVLRCARAEFAEQLLTLNPGRLAAPAPGMAHGEWAWQSAIPRLDVRWMISVLGLTALLSAGSYVVHRPRVQVLNLTDAPLTLEVDGEVVARVPVTSQESSEAGVTLRLPAGRRHFRVLSADDPVAEADVTLQGGTRHLYAPASDDHCFWLERIGYGRGNASEPSPGAVERLPLGNPLRFWAFPQPPDVWLAPPPEPLLDDARSSGGEVTALRQARCTDAPVDARP